MIRPTPTGARAVVGGPGAGPIRVVVAGGTYVNPSLAGAPLATPARSHLAVGAGPHAVPYTAPAGAADSHRRITRSRSRVG